MPEPAQKPVTPPSPLADRSEGWGVTGQIVGYQTYKTGPGEILVTGSDDGSWPYEITRTQTFEPWPTETSDDVARTATDKPGWWVYNETTEQVEKI